VAAVVRHYDLRRVLAGIRGELEAGTAAMAAAMRNQLLQNKLRLERMGRALEVLSPLAILERGYALVLMARGIGEGCGAGEGGGGHQGAGGAGEIRATVKKATPVE